MKAPKTSRILPSSRPSSTTRGRPCRRDHHTVLGARRDIDQELRIIYTPDRAPGEEIEVTALWDICDRRGEYVIAVTADAFGQIIEVRKDNNSASIHVVVRDARVDLPQARRPDAVVGTIRAILASTSASSGGASDDGGPARTRPRGGPSPAARLRRAASRPGLLRQLHRAQLTPLPPTPLAGVPDRKRC
jgi:hypothetical protein